MQLIRNSHESRNRHVKCDETKPHCKRCTTVGRRCEGYEPPKPSRSAMRNMMILYVAPQQVPRAIMPMPKHREVDQYHRYVAPKLAAFFDSPFWQSLILQMSQSEPAIRHAVSAITSVHKDMECAPIPIPGRPIVPNTVALREIGEAMRSLSTRIQADPSSSLVPLVACLLFTCLECMRGSVDGAMQHMTSGFKVLNAARTQTNHKKRMTQSELDMIEDHVVPFFTRLNLVCITFGRNMPVMTPSYDMTSQFRSLDDARRNLYELGSQIAGFIRNTVDKVEAGIIEIDDIIERTKLQRLNDLWSVRMDEYLETCGPKLTPAQRTAVDLCLLHSRTLSIWLSVSQDGDECTMDPHTEEFEAILDIGERIITAYTEAGPVGQPPKFSFEMGVIPSLYYTAMKCRVSHLRRRALNLLHRAPRREGLWNAHVAARVAESIMKWEEEWTLATGGVIDQNVRIYGAGPSSGQIPRHLINGDDLLLSFVTGTGQVEPSHEESCLLHSDKQKGDTIEVTMRAKQWPSSNEFTRWKQVIQL